MKVFQLDFDRGPWDEIERWLVLAPHPDDFDVVAVTLRRLKSRGARIRLAVLGGGASGVEDDFAKGWEDKVETREREQRESCERFGLDPADLEFHRLAEDPDGFIRDDSENDSRIREILDRSGAGGVVLPHGNDSNADHRRVFRCFSRWRDGQMNKPLALLVRDPKTLESRLDLVTVFGQSAAEWKGELLRCHVSQHERNLKSRGRGFDERILDMNREIGRICDAPFAEGFEVGGD